MTPRLAIVILCGVVAALGALCWVGASMAQESTVDVRCCVPVARDPNGTILRSRSVLAAFRGIHPCPATSPHPAGTCPGWAIDHVIPLVCGGKDVVWNMQWLPNAIKSGPGDLPKDRWEQRVYCPRP